MPAETVGGIGYARIGELSAIIRDNLSERLMATRHFLLVSGPSGGGKSTFIDRLARAALPADIADRLPAGCAGWPVAEVNDMLKNGIGADALLAGLDDSAGVILHYDIAYIHRFALPGYASDPAAALFELGDPLDVVLIKPDLARLTAQHASRRAAHRRAKGKARLLWGDWVRRPLRRALLRLRGHPAVDTEVLYGDPDWLRRCYDAWRDHVLALVAGRPAARFIEVEPVVTPDGAPGFRLLPPP